jgi:hypothetical protein
MNVLWVLPKNTFPVNDGAKKANHSLMKSLFPKLQNVDILVFNEESINPKIYSDSFKFNNIFFIPRKKYNNFLHKVLLLLIQLLKRPDLPMTASFFAEENAVSEINKILNNNVYDYIIFDGLHPYLGFIGLIPTKTQIIYRAHNVEKDLWITKASKTKNFLFKNFLLWQGRLMAKLELDILKSAKCTWTISEDDQQVFRKLVPQGNFKNIFVGLDFNESNIENNNTSSLIKLMFLGKLDWEPNRDGLKWFLENVWPHVDYSKVQLTIAGSGDSSWGKELFNQPNLKVLGFIESVDLLYSSSDFSIIPIMYGSGTRIKVIESVSKNVPLISTAMGIQGSGLEQTDYIHVESSVEWINAINSLSINEGRIISKLAFSKLKELYNPDNVALVALNTLLK